MIRILSHTAAAVFRALLYPEANTGAMARNAFYHQSPLMKGLPFFAFMALGTYTLSLFVQTRYDYAVRRCCSAS